MLDNKWTPVCLKNLIHWLISHWPLKSGRKQVRNWHQVEIFLRPQLWKSLWWSEHTKLNTNYIGEYLQKMLHISLECLDCSSLVLATSAFSILDWVLHPCPVHCPTPLFPSSAVLFCIFYPDNSRRNITIKKNITNAPFPAAFSTKISLVFSN